jgi:hypothetical protein
MHNCGVYCTSYAHLARQRHAKLVRSLDRPGATRTPQRSQNKIFCSRTSAKVGIDRILIALPFSTDGMGVALMALPDQPLRLEKNRCRKLICF